MRVLCPTCNRPMSDHVPMEALKDARIDPQSRIIVNTLAEAYPRPVSIARIFDALYGHDPNGGPDDPRAVVAVRICKLRRQLEPFGWTVPKNGSGRGNHGRYRLERIDMDDDETKRRKRVAA